MFIEPLAVDSRSLFSLVADSEGFGLASADCTLVTRNEPTEIIEDRVLASAGCLVLLSMKLEPRVLEVVVEDGKVVLAGKELDSPRVVD